MKRFLIAILVVAVSLSFVGGALAGPKPPKYLCLNWSGGMMVAAMAIKPHGGSVPMSSGKTKFYAIHGECSNGFDYSVPGYGTGHMNGDVFHFAVACIGDYAGNRWEYRYEGEWDVVTNSGTGGRSEVCVSAAGGFCVSTPDYDGGLTLTTVDCSATPILYHKGAEPGSNPNSPR